MLADTGGKLPWAESQTAISIREYIELFLASKFRDLNSAEPVSVSFIPNESSDAALLYLVRSVVTPDLDLTDNAEQKAEIVSAFQNNISKQADRFSNSCRKLFANKSISSRWPNATVEKNLVVRFVKSDNENETVALMVDGKTTFEAAAIAAASKALRERAGDSWLE